MTQSGFYSILFHALYKKRDHNMQVHPYMFIPVEEFKACIEILLENGFTFLNPAAMTDKRQDSKQILLTFDDGYYNNFYALEVLEAFSIKAIFFFVEHHIVHQKLFWWDVYFKNRINKVSFSTLYEEIQEYKNLQREHMEEKLKRLFGTNCFDAREDFDRPMKVNELKGFAEHPLVEIGVHSASHEVLTNCSSTKIKQEILRCKQFLEKVTSVDIKIISYPNGDFNDEIVSIVDELGFQWGITTVPGLNTYVNIINKRDRLRLKRNVFPVPKATGTLIDHIRAFVRQNNSHNAKNLHPYI